MSKQVAITTLSICVTEGNVVDYKVISKKEIQRILGVKNICSIDTQKFFHNEAILTDRYDEFESKFHPDYDAHHTIFITPSNSIRMVFRLLDKKTGEVQGYSWNNSVHQSYYMSISDTIAIIEASRKMKKIDKLEYIELLKKCQSKKEE